MGVFSSEFPVRVTNKSRPQGLFFFQTRPGVFQQVVAFAQRAHVECARAAHTLRSNTTERDSIGLNTTHTHTTLIHIGRWPRAAGGAHEVAAMLNTNGFAPGSIVSESAAGSTARDLLRGSLHLTLLTRRFPSLINSQRGLAKPHAHKFLIPLKIPVEHSKE